MAFPRIALFGICEDRNGSYLRGPASAPSLIRKAIRCDSSNNYSELGGLDVLTHLIDYDDVVPPEPNSEATSLLIKQKLQKVMVEDGHIPIMMGGDHSVTYPALKALTSLLGKPVVIVHFDAHPDIYPNYENNPWSHASPFARIMEAGTICTQLVSIGVRCASPSQIDQLKRFPVKWVEAKHFPAKGSDLRDILQPYITDDTAVYVSVDIDVLEPGLAPGISHREAGGLTVRQLVDALHSIPGQIVGADVVEYNPLQDVSEITAFVAAKIVREIAARMIAPDLATNYQGAV